MSSWSPAMTFRVWCWGRSRPLIRTYSAAPTTEIEQGSSIWKSASVSVISIASSLKDLPTRKFASARERQSAAPAAGMPRCRCPAKGAPCKVVCSPAFKTVMLILPLPVANCRTRFSKSTRSAQYLRLRAGLAGFSKDQTGGAVCDR